MAYQSIWYYSDLPEEIVEIIEKDLSEKYQDQMDESRLHGNALDKEKRNSRNAWIPTTEWVGGFIWHYITRANRENFLYDLTCIDGESIQFTEYGEGQFYSWHNDAGLATQYKPAGVGNHDSARVNDFMNEQLEQVRKLSFVVQLSNHDDYEGGNLQLMTESGKPYFAPPPPPALLAELEDKVDVPGTGRANAPSFP
jgi:predicted 2-oxoglutarate/Fe(II)-dependent dioxygenase YbiX